MDDLRSCRPALCGWGAVAVIVVGYDVWALLGDRETLSGAFWRARNHRQVRYLAVGVWGALTWHLLLGDKQLISEQMSATYRRNHPVWFVIHVLKTRASSPGMTPPNDLAMGIFPAGGLCA